MRGSVQNNTEIDTTELSGRGGRLVPATPSEFRCDHCRSRCTRGPDGVEYGHKYRCPDRPDHLPTGGGHGSASYYKGGESA